MPPSPIITASVNEPLYARLLAELDGIPRPQILFKQGTRSYGLWNSVGHPNGRITLYFVTDYDTDQLRFVASELSRTLLHETRHAWQHKHKPEWFDSDTSLPYARKKTEIDADEFEDTRLHDYRTLVKVRRSFPSSPFSRLAKTERSIR